MHQLTRLVSRMNQRRVATFGAVALVAGIVIPMGAIAPVTPAAQAAAAAPTYSFVAVSPCRVANVKLKRKRTVTRQVTGACGVPANAKTVALGLEAKKATSSSRVVVWQAGASRPKAATLTWTRPARSDTARETVNLSPGGAVSLWNQKGKVRVSVDVRGYWAPVSTVTTRAIDPMQMTLFGTTTTSPGTTNGCATNSDGGAATGVLSLDLPVGARLLSITTKVYDGGGADVYDVSLFRFVSVPTGLQTDEVVPLTSGGAASISVSTVTTAINHVVASGETFQIRMNNLKSFNNGLCQVFVTYDPAG